MFFSENAVQAHHAAAQIAGQWDQAAIYAFWLPDWIGITDPHFTGGDDANVGGVHSTEVTPYSEGAARAKEGKQSALDPGSENASPGYFKALHEDLKKVADMACDELQVDTSGSGIEIVTAALELCKVKFQ
jgi:hypothetical protein